MKEPIFTNQSGQDYHGVGSKKPNSRMGVRNVRH